MAALFTLPSIEFFSLDEMVCPCCNSIVLDDGLMMHLVKLDIMRKQYGRPIIINSGHRCAKHNAEVGGAPESWHLRFATDISPSIGRESDLTDLYKLALSYKWGGIGLYPSWIHLDMRPSLTRWRG